MTRSRFASHPALRGLALGCVVVFTAAPLTHGILEAAAFERVAHVEAETDDPCFSGHDEAMCQLCKLIQIRVPDGARVTVHPDTTLPHTPSDILGHRPDGLIGLTGAPPRAPPST